MARPGLVLLFATVLYCALPASAARFVVQNMTIGDIEGKRLLNQDTQESVTILPTQGGRVEELQLKSPKTHQLRDVLLTHNGNATAIKENALFKGALLLPFANRIAKGEYTFQGKHYKLALNGGLGNAIHGLLYDKSVPVVYTEVTDTTAILILQYTFGSDAGYPFPLRVDLTYVLTSEAFVIDVDAFNEHQTLPLPFYMGWHPYFKVEAVADTIVVFGTCSKYAHIDVDSTLIPTGSTNVTDDFSTPKPIGGTTAAPTHFDDGYCALEPTFESNCSSLTTTIYDTKAGEATYLFQEEAFRYTQVFTGAVALTKEQGVAVEPMSAETDAYNNHIGLKIIQGQEKWRGFFGISLGSGVQPASYHRSLLNKIHQRRNAANAA